MVKLFAILSFCLIEMGVMPEIAQALEEMDWLCVRQPLLDLNIHIIYVLMS